MNLRARRLHDPEPGGPSAGGPLPPTASDFLRLRKEFEEYKAAMNAQLSEGFKKLQDRIAAIEAAPAVPGDPKPAYVVDKWGWRRKNT